MKDLAGGWLGNSVFLAEYMYLVSMIDKQLGNIRYIGADSAALPARRVFVGDIGNTHQSMRDGFFFNRNGGTPGAPAAAP